MTQHTQYEEWHPFYANIITDLIDILFELDKIINFCMKSEKEFMQKWKEFALESNKLDTKRKNIGLENKEIELYESIEQLKKELIDKVSVYGDERIKYTKQRANTKSKLRHYILLKQGWICVKDEDHSIVYVKGLR